MKQKDQNIKERVIKKLELLADYQAKKAILNKETDKLSESVAKGKESEEIAYLKAKLQNKQ